MMSQAFLEAINQSMVDEIDLQLMPWLFLDVYVDLIMAWGDGLR